MKKELLIEKFVQACEKCRESGIFTFDEIPEFTVTRPAKSEFGDFTSNIAMTLAKPARKSPRDIADAIIKNLDIDPDTLDKIEIAGAGFINIYLKSSWLGDIVKKILESGENWGKTDFGKGTKILSEYVSANPNGPLSIPHGRGAMIGDVLTKVLRYAGFEVSSEFYVNDAANSLQMIRFGESLVIRYLQILGEDIDFPEEGYHGEYVKDFAKKIADEHGDKYKSMETEERLELFTTLGKKAMIEWQKEVLESFGVTFDRWYFESDLIESGAVEKNLDKLQEIGVTYTDDGALFMKTTDFGDDKDRALVRGNGKPTYFASDVAYHKDKFDRGFDRIIDIWGPDHHGYMARTRAAMEALGYSAKEVYVLIYQVVRLMKNGEFVMGGKRKGDIVLLSELINQVGSDAARYFFLLRSSDSDLNFDMDLAIKESNDNPVFYVQYAHARICSILRMAEERNIATDNLTNVDLSPLGDEAEASLIRRLNEFPEEINMAAEYYEPHRLTRYAQDIAKEFHAFYDKCPILKEGTNENVRDARLALALATKISLNNILTQVLGVSAPEKM